MAGAASVGWVIAAVSTDAGLPIWAAAIPGAVAVLVLGVMVFAPDARSAVQRTIRRGLELRDKIVRKGMDEREADALFRKWFRRARKTLRRHRPGFENRFMLAEGDRATLSGQALVIGHVNAKVAVLQEALSDG
jgi:hypothetical protein